MASGTSSQRTLGLFDTSCIMVGVIIGSGIYKTPADIAGLAGSATILFAIWILGGVLSLIGALCYAELASTYPRERGEYFYLTRAYGRWAGFVFAWTRLTVIHTGNIAIMATIASSYATQISGNTTLQVPIALGIIILFTVINGFGLVIGKNTQNLLVTVQISGLLIATTVMLLVARGTPVPTEPALPTAGNLYLAIILVLFTFGGWSDCAFVTAEMKNPSRNILRAMLLGLGTVTGIYLLVNWALLQNLGVDGMAGSGAVVADAMQNAVGPVGAVLISVLVIITALGSVNGMVLTGGRLFSTFGNDSPLFGFMKPRRNRIWGAFLMQGAIACLLVVTGRFEDLVIYTTAAHWLFFTLNGVALFRLRAIDPERERPYRVHGYPFTPVLFIASSGVLVYSSLMYAGLHSLIGFLLVGLGGLIYLVQKRYVSEPQDA